MIRSLILSAAMALALLVWAPRPLAAPAVVGTLVVTETDQGTVTLYKFAWTSSTGGAVSGNPFAVRKGRLMEVKFVPGTAGVQPSNSYGVTLIDTDGVDLLNGEGAGLSNAASSRLIWDPLVYNDGVQHLDLVVSAAGNAKSGTVYLWVTQ